MVPTHVRSLLFHSSPQKNQLECLLNTRCFWTMTWCEYASFVCSDNRSGGFSTDQMVTEIMTRQVPDEVEVAMTCDETINAIMEDDEVKRPEDSYSQPVVAKKGSFAGYSSGTVLSHIKFVAYDKV